MQRSLEGLLAGMALMVALVGCTGSALAARHVAETITSDTPAPAATPSEVPAIPVPPSEPAGPAPAPGNTADPAPPALGAADLAIAEKLREIVTGQQLARIFDRKPERDAVAAFYGGRSFAPLWIANGAANARAETATRHLAAAALDGLDPADYATPETKAGAEPGQLADAELRLTAAVVAYARHAQTGRVHFSRISSEISYDLAAPAPAEILSRMAETTDAGAALASYHPPHDGYKALRAKLADIMRRSNAGDPGRIAAGPRLKVGMQDERVPQLRKRLGMALETANTTYDKPLAQAVGTFQRQHKLPATGVLDQATIEALNGPRRDREIDIIIANMERWRWMPRNLGPAYSILNIPDFSMKVVRDGAVVWQTKTVVGKPSTPTPILSDTMKFITVNPTWNVPPSILNNQYLPALRQDPTVLARMGIRVVRNPDGTIRMYQPPGDRNALGRLRFNFPNKFLVYQHDTPDRYLFAKEQRAYSNGCMRVQDPLKYADVLLRIAAPKEEYTQERLQRLIGGAERNISFQMKIPVHLTYQTAFVDASGKLVIRSDIYGYDGKIRTALTGSNRRVADIAVPTAHRHADQPRKPAPRRWAPREVRTMPSLFDQLFR